MTFKRLTTCIATVAFLFAISSCKQQNPVAQINEENLSYFGDQISSDGAIAYEDLYAQLGTVDELENVKVKAKVTGVCQAKGCWMNLTSTKAEGENQLFVKFKDYGFFMPKDIAGREVIVEGRAYKEVTPVDELRHYAEDEGLSEAEILAITEPKEELKFMAHGVILLDE